MQLQLRHRPVPTKQSNIDYSCRITRRLQCPPLFHPCPSILPVWFDLHCYNYWVIFTVITLNICSVTMLKSLTVLFDGYSQKDAPIPSSVPQLPFVFMCYLHWRDEMAFIWLGAVWLGCLLVRLSERVKKKSLKRFNQEDSCATARSASELKRIVQAF